MIPACLVVSRINKEPRPTDAMIRDLATAGRRGHVELLLRERILHHPRFARFLDVLSELPHTPILYIETSAPYPQGQEAAMTSRLRRCELPVRGVYATASRALASKPGYRVLLPGCPRTPDLRPDLSNEPRHIDRVVHHAGYLAPRLRTPSTPTIRIPLDPPPYHDPPEPLDPDRSLILPPSPSKLGVILQAAHSIHVVNDLMRRGFWVLADNPCLWTKLPHLEKTSAAA